MHRSFQRRKDSFQVIWYKLTDAGQSTLSVGKHLITRDARFSVAYYSLDHGISPAKWDLHLTHVRLSDAAQYQCHVVSKETHRSSRSTVQLVVEGKRGTASERHSRTRCLRERESRERNRRRSDVYNRREIIMLHYKLENKQTSKSDPIDWRKETRWESERVYVLG